MPPIRDLVGIKPVSGNEPGEVEDVLMPRAEEDLVSPMPYAEDLTPAPSLKKDELKEPAQKMRTGKKDAEVWSRQPGVDTTECRPSDARVTKDPRGPF